jgi:hypothetical protein
MADDQRTTTESRYEFGPGLAAVGFGELVTTWFDHDGVKVTHRVFADGTEVIERG